MQHSEKITSLIKTLPDQPGVYQYFDSEGKILYVGKAKNLRKRVSSYFTRDVHENNKTTVLVKKVADIKYIVVETEAEALLLENSLIKQLQPRYNVMLKDDKTYPWIRITNERFPKVFPTRNIVKDGSQYFGPYASVKVMHTLLELIRQLYPLRNCNLNLSKENIDKGKFKVCLEYHIGNCKGPCEGLQEEAEYNETIVQVRDIIKGNIHSVLRHMRGKMNTYAQNYEFEKAQFLKEKIDLLEKFQGKSTVVSPYIHDVDVFAIATDEKAGYVNFLKVLNGAIVQGHTIELRKKLDESPEELLELAITELRQLFNSDSREIIVPFPLDVELPNIEMHVPQRGDKKKLLELSERNVDYYRKEKEKQEALVDPERHTKRIMQTMMRDLRLKEEPRHIECFDNSNIQGAFPVAAMTVFKDGKPSKKDYRHFNIKTVEGPNDFASMEEVIYRRYKRMLDENQPVPQLIVIDGGKGQLGSAMNSLDKLGLRGRIAVIGIAKKLEEIYYPGDPLPLYLDKKSETLRIIQQIRNEAHRFGITHHRKRREKGTIKTELTGIPGISDKTAQKLLGEFKSVKRIKELSVQDMEKLIGLAKARAVYDHFHPVQGNPLNAASPSNEAQ